MKHELLLFFYDYDDGSYFVLKLQFLIDEPETHAKIVEVVNFADREVLEAVEVGALDAMDVGLAVSYLHPAIFHFANH